MRLILRSFVLLGSLATLFSAVSIRAQPATPAADGPAPIPVSIQVDAARSKGALRPIWRFFGADEPNYAYMKDGRKLLAALGQLGTPQVYFRTHDAFLLPTALVAAFPHDQAGTALTRVLATPRGERPYLDLCFWISFASLAGLPATTAPVGFTRGGLPVGIQIVGPYLEDATPIDLAGRLADVIGGFRPPPGF